MVSHHNVPALLRQVLTPLNLYAGDGVVGGADHGAQHPKQPIAAGAGGDRRQRFLSLLTAHLVLNLNGLRGGHIDFGIGLGSLTGLAFKHLKGGA